MQRWPVPSLALVALLVALVVPAAAQAPAPGADTGGVRGVERTLATLVGSVDPNGVATQWFFEYGANGFGANTEPRNAGAGDDRVSVSAQVGSLRPGTRYQYRLVARSDGGVVRGATRTFTTANAPQEPIFVQTGGPRDVDQRTAAVIGAYNARGRTGTWRFLYGKTGQYGQATDPQPVDPTGNQDVSARLEGLDPDTRYHYRLVLDLDGVGQRRGTDRTFTTTREPNGLLIEANPERVLAGRGTQVAGILAGSGNSNVRVSVQADAFPFDGGFREVASGVTDATGAYAVQVPSLTRTSQLRTVANTRPTVTSQVITVPVELDVSMRVSDTRVARGDKVRFRGTVAPGQAGARVLIQRRVDGEYERVRGTRQRAGADGSSRYSRKIRIRQSGRYRVLARAADGGNVPGTSRSIRIRARG